MIPEICLVFKQFYITVFAEGTSKLISKAKQAMDIPIDIAWLTNCYGSYTICTIARQSSHHQPLSCRHAHRNRRCGAARPRCTVISAILIGQALTVRDGHGSGCTDRFKRQGVFCQRDAGRIILVGTEGSSLCLEILTLTGIYPFDVIRFRSCCRNGHIEVGRGACRRRRDEDGGRAFHTDAEGLHRLVKREVVD